MTDKSTRWQFTAFEGQYPILDALANDPGNLIAEIGWQDEIAPETQKKHRQGYVRTVRQVRFKQLQEVLSGVHLEVAKNWSALLNYCKKAETKDPSGNQVHVQYERPMRLHEMLIEVANSILIAHPPETKHAICLDSQTDRQILLQYLRQYSQPLVHCHPEYGVVLSRQDARDAWCNYIEVWLAKAAQQTREGQ